MTTLILTTCDSCPAPVPALPVIQMGRPYTCPTCATREALEDAAGQHLHALIYSTVLDWARHWNAAGVSDSALSAVLSVEGMYWHPDGARYRGSGDAFDSGDAVIREALGAG
ncbi:hypothetical protein [Deinococcus marmoris]|uniref:hypothetical protein n=1 Tax=Deinococcus marmoris TaxID=249408 RepID=UPI000496AC1C|nr:hypothetical protein [Deinococcus marmoris]